MKVIIFPIQDLGFNLTNISEVTYDDEKRVTSVTYKDNLLITLEYGDGHQVIKYKDRLGNWYDADVFKTPCPFATPIYLEFDSFEWTPNLNHETRGFVTYIKEHQVKDILKKLTYEEGAMVYSKQFSFILINHGMQVLFKQNAVISFPYGFKPKTEVEKILGDVKISITEYNV